MCPVNRNEEHMGLTGNVHNNEKLLCAGNERDSEKGTPIRTRHGNRSQTPDRVEFDELVPLYLFLVKAFR
jgi:hypothetical protein